MRPSTPAVAELLAHAGWMHRLARRLVHDAAEAADVVQESWAAVARNPPDPGRPPRSWLAEVVRNAARMYRRGEGRRRAREAAAAPARSSAERSAEELLERAELHRLLAQLVLDLDEPYRSTVLLRYHEDLNATAIAKLQGVEAGTVRWRLKRALDLLRARLDERDRGAARSWVVVLGKGALVMSGKAKVPLFAIGLVLLALVGGGALWVRAARHTGGGPSTADPTPPARSPAAPSAFRASADTPAMVPAGAVAADVATDADASPGGAMDPGRAARLALPAVAAALERRRTPLTREQAIDACVANRERVLPCRDAFAEAYTNAAIQDEDVRAMLVRHARQEIERDGAGPIEPRRQSCARAVDARVRATWGDLDEVHGCFELGDCTAQAACAVPIFQRLKAPLRRSAPEP